MRTSVLRWHWGLRALLVVVVTPNALTVAALLAFMGVPVSTDCFLARCHPPSLQGRVIGGSLMTMAALSASAPLALLALVTGRRGWLWAAALVSLACSAYGLSL